MLLTAEDFQHVFDEDTDTQDVSGTPEPAGDDAGCGSVSSAPPTSLPAVVEETRAPRAPDVVGKPAEIQHGRQAPGGNAIYLSDEVWTLLTDELAYRVKASRGMDATLDRDTVAEDLIRYAIKRLGVDRGRKR